MGGVTTWKRLLWFSRLRTGNTAQRWLALSDAGLADCLENSRHAVVTTAREKDRDLELLSVQMTRDTLQRICAVLRRRRWLA